MRPTRDNVCIPLICRPFRTCSARELRAVRGLGTLLDVPAGRRLCSEDLSRPEFVIVVQGVVQMFRRGRLVHELTAGDFFGHESLLAGDLTEGVTAIAAAPSRIAVFTRFEFRSLLTALPSVGNTLRDAVASGCASTHRAMPTTADSPSRDARPELELITEACLSSR
jgi:CRP-like cAMP-binding protein